jgi:hypothetical protein
MIIATLSVALVMTATADEAIVLARRALEGGDPLEAYAHVERALHTNPGHPDLNLLAAAELQIYVDNFAQVASLSLTSSLVGSERVREECVNNARYELAGGELRTRVLSSQGSGEPHLPGNKIDLSIDVKVTPK